MLYFLHGEDMIRVAERRRELMDGFQKKYPTGEIHLFDFEDTGTPEMVRRACSACDQGLFATPKLVVWLHPLALKEGEDAVKNFLKRFLKEAPLDISLLVIEPGKIKKTNSIAAFLLKKADRTEDLSVLSGASLETWVLKSLAAFDPHLSISRPALMLLLKGIGSDTLRLKQVIDQLASYRGTGEIVLADVMLFVQAGSEAVIFQALDALARGEREKALLLFAREQAAATKHDAVYGLLSMCAWQLRRLLLIREAYDQGMHDSPGIARHTKLPPFTVQNALRGLNALPRTRLAAGLSLLAEMDAALKIGALDPGVALDTFVWKF